MSQITALTLGKRIGGGRLSDIYVSQLNGIQVAVKVQEPDDDAPPHSSRNELKILQLIHNEGGGQVTPTIVPFLGFYESGLQLSFVFPLYKYDLTAMLKACSKSKTIWGDNGSISRKIVNGLSTDRIQQIFKGLVEGLAFIHSLGIIHRDINPNNIMFETQDSQPVIIDFGISWVQPNNFGKEPADTKFTDIATGLYKAPELLLSVQNYSSAVDIWASANILSLISSQNGKLLLDEDGAHSDLSLLGSIFDKFGTPTVESWPEASTSNAFIHISPNLILKEPHPIDEMLFKLAGTSHWAQWQAIFSGMTLYESSTRLTASKILEILNTMT